MQKVDVISAKPLGDAGERCWDIHATEEPKRSTIKTTS
jgi:hypothetical protein